MHLISVSSVGSVNQQNMLYSGRTKNSWQYTKNIKKNNWKAEIGSSIFKVNEMLNWINKLNKPGILLMIKSISQSGWLLVNLVSNKERITEQIWTKLFVTEMNQNLHHYSLWISYKLRPCALIDMTDVVCNLHLIYHLSSAWAFDS